MNISSIVFQDDSNLPGEQMATADPKYFTV
jgi:hypothetical protein